jgi:tetratricopeptide (TPR) repeat protein
MRAGRYADAKAAYEAALVERPNSGFPLYGIAQADAAAGNKVAATKDYGALLSAWSKADPELPQMVAAKAWFAASVLAAESGTAR